jgi:hypothetical protein
MKTTLALPLCVMTALVIGAPGIRSAQVAAKKGTVEHVKVHGKSLEGNLANEPADPAVSVYLPPSYSSERSRRCP